MATLTPSDLSGRTESCSANALEIIDLCSDDSEGPQPRGKPVSTDRVACHESKAEDPELEGVPASSCVICTFSLHALLADGVSVAVQAVMHLMSRWSLCQQ